MAHLTVTGGTFGGGERAAQSIFEYHVPASAFPADAHYVALGHLHRRQTLPAPCPVVYSGSPFAVDFGEQDNIHVVCLVEATPTTPAKITDMPITAGRRLRTVHGTVAELVARADEFGDDFLRVYVREPTSAGLREAITDALPNALEVRIDPEFAAVGQPGPPDRRTTPTAHRASCSPSTAPRSASPTTGCRRCSSSCTTDHLDRLARLRDTSCDRCCWTWTASRRSAIRRPSTSPTPTISPWSGRPGPGKSTVIDAMTFALYGSVPRWQDRRMVMYALAPTANRGTVRLVFDVERPAVRRRPGIAAGQERRRARSKVPGWKGFSTRPPSAPSTT